MFNGEKEEYKNFETQERLTIYEYLEQEKHINKEEKSFQFLLCLLEAITQLHAKNSPITMTKLTERTRKIATDYGEKQWDQDYQNLFIQRIIGYENRLDCRWRYVHFLMYLYHLDYIEFDEYRRNSLFGRFTPSEDFYFKVVGSIKEELDTILSLQYGETITLQSNKNPFYNQVCYFEFRWSKKSYIGAEKVQGKIKHISEILAKDFILISKNQDGREIPITLYDYWEQKHARLFTPEQLEQMKYDRVVTIEFGREKYKEIWNWANPIVYPSSLVKFIIDGREVDFDFKARELLQEIFKSIGFDESVHREAIKKMRDSVEKNEPELVNLIIKEKTRI
jgi:hypothetical protein